MEIYFQFLWYYGLSGSSPPFYNIHDTRYWHPVNDQDNKTVKNLPYSEMVKYIYEVKMMMLALQRSLRKILVFMCLIIVTMLGSIVFLIEGGANGFDYIPTSIYRGIITLTTVGYGDIVPATSLGKFVATAIMMLSYSIIAIPLGMISFEFSRPVAQERPSHAFCNHYP